MSSYQPVLVCIAIAKRRMFTASSSCCIRALFLSGQQRPALELGMRYFSGLAPAPSVLSRRRSSGSSQRRHRGNLPMNTIVNFVPQQEAWHSKNGLGAWQIERSTTGGSPTLKCAKGDRFQVIERMGRYFRILQPGLNVLLPIVDKVKYVQSLKEIAIEIPQQSAITVDNVALQIDGVLYLRVEDAYKASYGVEDPEFAITQLAQTTMRSEVGKIILDTVFREREVLNDSIVLAINKASEPWGISCKRYEIRDMKMPPKIQEAMQMQVEAERKKRATVLESEGFREAEINVAEGRKRATILKSEADKLERINVAVGEADAMLAKAKARAQSIEIVAGSLQNNKDGHDAATFAVAEQYVQAFGKIAKENNTLILPANAGDATGMVAQALTVYKTLVNKGSPVAEKYFGKVKKENETG